jgi:serine/threonine-protein kinase HipA
MTIAEVLLWGRTIGAVSLRAGQQFASFQYAKDFAQSGIQVSPIQMPLDTRTYRFPELALQSFHGLPGLLADSLPDRFGNALIEAWLSSIGRRSDSFDAVERLCYTGTRGMGALEFRPATGIETVEGEAVQIGALVKLASQVLRDRVGWSVDLSEDSPQRDKAAALASILHVGTSAGGARAKAVVAWNEVTNEVFSGQVKTAPGFSHWLLKFDGVDANRDKELDDPQGFGAIEFAYSLMAGAAGVSMSECRLFEEGGRRHFMTKRFDRTQNGKKLHMQSLAALAHYDFNLAGVYSYEQALLCIRTLNCGMEALEQQFRRMVFNIVARNQDDHVKNIAFLMDKAGVWTLAPAYDVTYSYNPNGAWTSQHQMTVNAKRDQFSMDDLRRCAQGASLKRGRCEAIVEEVIVAVDRWPEYASAAGVTSVWIDEIGKHFRRSLPSS